MVHSGWLCNLVIIIALILRPNPLYHTFFSGSQMAPLKLQLRVQFHAVPNQVPGFLQRFHAQLVVNYSEGLSAIWYFLM